MDGTEAIEARCPFTVSNGAASEVKLASAVLSAAWGERLRVSDLFRSDEQGARTIQAWRVRGFDISANSMALL